MGIFNISGIKTELRQFSIFPFPLYSLHISIYFLGLRVLGLVVFDSEQDRPGHGVLINGDGEVEDTISLTYYRFVFTFSITVGLFSD